MSNLKPDPVTPTSESTQQTDAQKDSIQSAGSGSSFTTEVAAQPSAQSALASDQPTAEQLEKLRPELRGIAKRYGVGMLEFAVRVAGANVALDWLQTYSITHSKVRAQQLMLCDAQAHFCNMVMEAKGWKWDDLGECMLDISRAAQLAQPAAGRPS